jgi:hypothetical protein
MLYNRTAQNKQMHFVGTTQSSDTQSNQQHSEDCFSHEAHNNICMYVIVHWVRSVYINTEAHSKG